MNKFILFVLLAITGLVACTLPEHKRTGPSAPIIIGGRPVPTPAPAKPQPATPPRTEQVKVYPYRPFASASDASTPWGAPPAAETPRADRGPISERATGIPATSSPNQGTPPVRSAPTPVAPTLRVVASAPSSLPMPNLSPAAGTLVKQAERKRRARDYVGAVAILERALGIQPRDPYIWNRLARVRMEQGLYTQAGNLASRSNVLARERQVALKRDNWTIIAAARQAAGDMAGALEARRNVRGG